MAAFHKVWVSTSAPVYEEDVHLVGAGLKSANT